MKRVAHAVRRAAALGLCSVALAAQAGARFEPPDGRTILIVGQERGEIADYWKQVGPAGGYMLYTNIATLTGLDGATRGRGCSDSGWMDFGDWLKNYPDTVVQIGLYMVGSSEDIAAGELDPVIADMAELLRATKRPVFLRVGYEFDGPWNRYDPAIYRKAFARVANILKGRRVGPMEPIAPADNVALVWHSAAYDTYMGHPIDDWYPGDDYVDWVAVSWFQWATPADEAAAAEARDTVARFAKTHGKPLMIAEAAPKHYFESDSDEAWRGWHSRVFDWIAQHDVKAYSYINQDWNRMPQWQAACGNGADWGNTRIQKPGSRVIDQWKTEIAKPRWLVQGADLMKAIGR
jgi:hypothetical protein